MVVIFPPFLPEFYAYDFNAKEGQPDHTCRERRSFAVFFRERSKQTCLQPNRGVDTTRRG